MSRFLPLTQLGEWFSRPFSSRPCQEGKLPASSPTRGSADASEDTVSSDSPAAINRARTAAEAGDAAAQNSLGLRFVFGHGVLRSEAEARKWLNRAATQGYAEAQFNLGNLCYSISLKVPGLCDEAGRIEAYVWLHLAAAQGHVRAKADCEMLNLRLTDAELTAGNQRAHAFQSRKETATPAGVDADQKR